MSAVTPAPAGTSSKTYRPTSSARHLLPLQQIGTLRFSWRAHLDCAVTPTGTAQKEPTPGRQVWPDFPRAWAHTHFAWRVNTHIPRRASSRVRFPTCGIEFHRWCTRRSYSSPWMIGRLHRPLGMLTVNGSRCRRSGQTSRTGGMSRRRPRGSAHPFRRRCRHRCLRFRRGHRGVSGGSAVSEDGRGSRSIRNRPKSGQESSRSVDVR